jgi:hypothetical protein
VWPRVLEEYGRLPTQLYRFVRHGNLEGFVSQVGVVAAAATAAAAPTAETLQRPREKGKRRQPIHSEASETAAAQIEHPREKTTRRQKVISK